MSPSEERGLGKTHAVRLRQFDRLGAIRRLDISQGARDLVDGRDFRVSRRRHVDLPLRPTRPVRLLPVPAVDRRLAHALDARQRELRSDRLLAGRAARM